MLKLIKAIKHAKHSHFHRIATFSSDSYSDKPRGYNVCVGIFWDVETDFRKSYYPYNAAIKLRRAAEQLGDVKYKVAHADCHAWTVAPLEVKPKRKRNTRKAMEKWADIEPQGHVVPHCCIMCSRKFHTLERLLNHFSNVHRTEYLKRVRELEDAKGKRRVNLVGRYSRKMDKFRYAAREMSVLQHGYCLGEELKRGGFWVKEVPDKSREADDSLRDLIMDMMDHERIGCLVLASKDPEYEEVLREARLRGLKTVVIGDHSGGVLMRAANASFSWDDVMRGRAKAGTATAVGRWKDRDVLRRLEWTYDPKTDGKKLYPEIDSDVESEFVEFISDEDDDDDEAFYQKGNAGAWWELKSDDTTNPVSSQAVKSDYDSRTSF